MINTDFVFKIYIFMHQIFFFRFNGCAEKKKFEFCHVSASRFSQQHVRVTVSCTQFAAYNGF